MSTEDSSISRTKVSVIGESNETNNEIRKQTRALEIIELYSTSTDDDDEAQKDAQEVEEEEEGFKTNKSKKTSHVRKDFEEIVVNGKNKARCSHCHSFYAIAKTATTTSLLRHLKIFVKRKIAI